MKRYVLMALGTVVLAPSSTWAQGKGRPSDVGYSRVPVVEERSHALQSSWDRMDKAYDRSAADVSRAAGDYSQQLSKAEQYRQQAQERMEAKNREIASYRAELSKVGDDLKQLSGSDYNHPETKAHLKNARKSFDAMSGKIDQLETEAKQLESEYGKANDEAGKLREKVAASMNRDFNMDVKPGDDLQAKLKEMNESVIKQRKMEGAARITDQFLDDVRADYLKSGILVSDMQNLKQQKGYTQEQLDLLQNKVSGRLDNTMLGKYVHEQIGKAMAAYCQNPKVAAACAQGQVDQLQELLKGTLGPNPAEKSSSGMKTQDVQEGGKPAAPKGGASEKSSSAQ